MREEPVYPGAMLPESRKPNKPLHVVRNMKVLLLGHRGFKRFYPENTIPAFRKALRCGADGIEFDVWLTKDGKLVVIHDRYFRVDGETFDVKALRLNEIRRLHPFGPLIPTAEELIGEFPGSYFNVDVKDIEAVEKVLDVAGDTEKVIISADNPAVLRALREGDGKVRLGFSIITWSSLFRFPALKRELGLYSLHVPVDAVDYVGLPALKFLLGWARSLGVKIALWNYRQDEFRYLPPLIRYCDILISDDVSKASRFLRERLFR
ncbi:glycerophosphodiester phosphodiesterase family protein [Thermococcus atlanticus]